MRFSVGADIASREENEEDCRRDPLGLHTCSWATGRTDKRWRFRGKRTSDESCAQDGGSEEVDGRMDMSKADGMAS